MRKLFQERGEASEEHEKDFLQGLSQGAAGKGQQEGEGKMRREDKQGQSEGEGKDANHWAPGSNILK